jgi:hypothetical protein
MAGIAATVTAGTHINKVTDLLTIKCYFLCRTATACLAHSDMLDGVTATHWCVGTWGRSYVKVCPNTGAQQLSWYSDEALDWLIQGSTSGRRVMSFLSPERPHWLWGTQSFPFGGYQGAFSPGGEEGVARNWPLISIDFQVEERVELYCCSPYALMLWTGTALPLPLILCVVEGLKFTKNKFW